MAVVHAGVTAAEAVESAELPSVFVAKTLKVYGVPFVRPVTTPGDAEKVVPKAVYVESSVLYLTV
jgi:hypothetical protein